MSDPHDFIKSIDKFLVPVALREGLSPPAWIPRDSQEILGVLKGSPFDLLVYCPAGHGVNMTISVAPDAKGWNPSNELGLAWLCRALGLGQWPDARYATSAEREEDIEELSRRLPQLLSAARARGPALWDELREYFRRNGHQNR